MFRMLALLSALALPLLAHAQDEPIRIGFLTVRTGPLAAGGKQMEQDIQLFWKYDPKQFLASPVYSRDFPPAKNLEQ